MQSYPKATMHCVVIYDGRLVRLDWFDIPSFVIRRAIEKGLWVPGWGWVAGP